MAARPDPMTGFDTILSVRDLTKHFAARRTSFIQRGEAPVIKAVDGVSFDLQRGQSLGIAGESGSGKTTTARMLLKLIEPTGGSIVFDGMELGALDGPGLKTFRRKAQLMFQNPYDAFNPRFTIYRSLVEPLLIHGIGAPDERRQKVIDTLRQVHLEPAEDYLDKHPHHLSGGQLQRVVLARALILDPAFLIADEPVSMLDVSIRAGILNTIRELSQRRGLTTLYISHDLSLLQYMCDVTAVMYKGKIVEFGPTLDLLSRPQHAYTRALIDAVPVPEPPALRRP